MKNNHYFSTQTLYPEIRNKVTSILKIPFITDPDFYLGFPHYLGHVQEGNSCLYQKL